MDKERDLSDEEDDFFGDKQLTEENDSSEEETNVSKDTKQTNNEEFVMPNNQKQRTLLFKKIIECRRKAHEIVCRLCDDSFGTDDEHKEYFLTSICKLTVQHYDDVIEERSILKICGWPLCQNKVEKPPKQKFTIRNNKVYDLTDRKKYCSSQCYGLSDNLKDQIPRTPLWLREEAETIELTTDQKQGQLVDLMSNIKL